MMPSVLCLGTTPALQRVMVFDRFTLGEANRAAELHEGSAGKTINVAKVAHALGAPTRVISLVGGRTGELIRRDLDQLGVPHDLVSCEVPTRVCVTVIDRATGGITECVEEAGRVSDAELDQLRQRFEAALTEAGVLVLSGSLAPGVPRDFYAYCVARASSLGVRTILDAQTEPLRLALPQRPFAVKPNRSELGWTLGVKIDSEAALHEAVKKLIASGPSWVAITAGRESILVSDGQRFWRLAPPRVEAVNPIGSGDAFAAGMAVGLVRGQAMPHVVALGAACGASNALHMLPGQIELQQVQELQRSIQVEVVKVETQPE